MNPLKRAGLCIGELVGYRIWEVHEFNGVPTLRSWFYECFWPPGEIVSDITYPIVNDKDIHIGDHNKRGVWSFKTPELLDNEYRTLFAFGLAGSVVVFGSCFIWGTIIEHERGYRAQHARPRSLDRCSAADCNLEFLRKRYGI